MSCILVLVHILPLFLACFSNSRHGISHPSLASFRARMQQAAWYLPNSDGYVHEYCGSVCRVFDYPAKYIIESAEASWKELPMDRVHATKRTACIRPILDNACSQSLPSCSRESRVYYTFKHSTTLLTNLSVRRTFILPMLCTRRLTINTTSLQGQYFPCKEKDPAQSNIKH